MTLTDYVKDTAEAMATPVEVAVILAEVTSMATLAPVDIPMEADMVEEISVVPAEIVCLIWELISRSNTGVSRQTVYIL